MRVLSGIQPSGPLHIGNYFGALRQFIDLQNDNDAYYFVADYHALTSRQGRATASCVHVRRVRHDVVAGPRPEKATLVRPVGCSRDDRAGLAALERDADGLAGEVRELQGQDPAGLARRARALRLSRASGGRHPALRRRPGAGRPGPEAAPRDHARHRRAIQPGLRRRRRTSSGCPSRTFSRRSPSFPAWTVARCPRATTTRSRSSTSPATITKKVKKIVTDSTPVEAPKNPETCPLFNLFRLFAAPGDLAEVERRYREGGIGYGEVKSRLAEAMIARFSDARERRADWLAHPERVAEVRAAAAARARATARIVLDRARAACGVG